MENYGPIANLVSKVFNIELTSLDLYNYIYRAKNGAVKNLGKADKGAPEIG